MKGSFAMRTALHKKGVWNPRSSERSVDFAQAQGSRHLFCAKLMRTGRLLVAACLLISTPLILQGCSKPPGTVSGTVTFKGKPLTHGQVVFYTQQDNGVFAHEIDSDGHY